MLKKHGQLKVSLITVGGVVQGVRAEFVDASVDIERDAEGLTISRILKVFRCLT
jgi:hypothetical protein